MAEDDKVGYGKPPKHSRFKKGVSGNPKGRPKGRKNLATQLLAELNKKVTVREGDKVLRVSKAEAMFKSLMQRAIKGDTKASSLVFAAMRQFGEDEPAAAAGSSGVLKVPGMFATDEDWEALARKVQAKKRRIDDEDG